VQNGGLKGLRVFIVEDEFAVLLMLEDILAELGCEVAASASRLAPALAAAGAQAFDAALLDINLAGEMVYPVAEALSARNVPIVFATGYGIAGVCEAWRHWPVLQKPYRPSDLAKALRQAVGHGSEARN
jgi:CheY-like chemotaxis protein